MTALAPDESAGPGAMSFSRAVPPAVPSVDHSSRPCEASFAVNSRWLPITPKPPGIESGAPVWMSFSNAVPAVVPSVAYSSPPSAGFVAPNSSFEPSSPTAYGFELPSSRPMSFTRVPCSPCKNQLPAR